jgi:hypothetical protein
MYPVQPTELLGLLFITRPRPTLQVDPESPALNHLKIYMPSTHFRVIKKQVRLRITADHGERLMQQPELGLVRARTLDDELKRIRDPTSVQELFHDALAMRSDSREPATI